MARIVEWSDDAIRDVEEIAAYIDKSSPQNAAVVIKEIRETTLRLQPFPMAYRMVPELRDPQLRETFVHRWRVMFRVFPDRIRIVGVIHGARLLSNAPTRSFEEGPQQEYVAS